MILISNHRTDTISRNIITPGLTYRLYELLPDKRIKKNDLPIGQPHAFLN
jgi:hypothetical protein